MGRRRCLVAIVLLSAALHAAGMARTILPAQDGLKFIRIARQFHLRPWTDAVRGADQHPLYPALIAAAQPAVSAYLCDRPDSWRVAAQLIAALASIALLIPLHGLARTLFDERIANLAALVYVLLPFPAAIGHDTLSDSLALLAFVTALRFGEVALRSGAWGAFLASGLSGGFGFLARPEVVIAPAAVVLAGLIRGRIVVPDRPRMVPRLAALSISLLVVVGLYALVKGEVSEKLALRIGASLDHRPFAVRHVEQWLPPGLDDPRWDFSPKEESVELAGSGAGLITGQLLRDWADGLGWVFAFFAIWGLVRDRHIRHVIRGEETPCRSAGRVLLASYLVLFCAVLVRHAYKMGYLSGRHTLTLVAVSVPWAAAGCFICARGVAVKLAWSTRFARGMGAAGLALMIVAGVMCQVKPGHPSRWGHWAAGRWLLEHTLPSDAVLDTRGWAAFVSGRPSYDYWHVRQALTDSHLAYVVVGQDELEGTSRRAGTLRALLAYAAKPTASFPERQGGHKPGVWIFRYERPSSWEGMRR